MKLILMRHGRSPSAMEIGVKTDDERPLSEAGRAQAARAGRALLSMDVRPARILASPLLRARETAEGAAAALGGPPVEVFAPLEAGADPEKLLEALSAHASEPILMLVGHQPDMGAFAAHLLAGEEDGVFSLSPGGMVLIELAGLADRSEVRLRWQLGPDQIAKLAG